MSNSNDSRPLSAYVAVTDPCIMKGCVLEYGHTEPHDYACNACGGNCQDHDANEEA